LALRPLFALTSAAQGVQNSDEAEAHYQRTEVGERQQNQPDAPAGNKQRGKNERTVHNGFAI
jgi:hypothetical protein